MSQILSVLLVSDTRSKGVTEDVSGPQLKKLLCQRYVCSSKHGNVI